MVDQQGGKDAEKRQSGVIDVEAHDGKAGGWVRRATTLWSSER